MTNALLNFARNPGQQRKPELPGAMVEMRRDCFVSGLFRDDRGFTMVEITLALGIVAFGFIAIFGLVPLGLATARKAMEASTGSQIVQRVVAEVKQTDFQKLANLQMSFDDQATLVPAANAQKIYDAQVTIVPNVSLPGAAIVNSNLVCVKIEVANNPGRSATPFNGALPMKVYSAFVARSTPLAAN